VAAERSRTTTFIMLGAAFVVAAGFVYAAFAQDAHEPAVTAPPLDAGDLVAQAGALGTARVLPSAGPDPRIEITFALNPDLMPDDLGIISLTSPFIIGQMKTGTTRQKVDGDLERVSIHHHILPAVAWFQDEAARRNRAWVGALMQWELDVTQRELLALYPDATVPDSGLPKPPSLTVTGTALRYPAAVKRIPDLGTEAAKKFLCMGEQVCDDSLLSKVLVIVVE
jgi:hypothetical protein